VARVTGTPTVVLAPRRRGGLVVAVLLGLGAFAVAGLLIGSFALPSLFGTTVREQPNAVVLAKIEKMAELQAATGTFETVVDVESDTQLLPDWVKGERTVLVAEGEVAATVNFADLDEDALEISEDGKEVTVHLPAPTLQEVEIDREGTRVIARDRGMLDRVNDALTSGNPTDDEELYDRAEEKLYDAATQSDLSEQAEESTTEMLTGMLEGVGFEEVTIVFDEPAEPGDSL